MKAAKRKPVTTAQGRKVRQRAPNKRQPANTAIVVRPAAAPEPWLPSDEEKILIKNVMCPGATDQEFAMCLAEARHRRLDPLKKQIWFIPRWNSEAENADGSRGRKVWVAQTSIDGLRHIAARDHADYGTEDEPEFGPMVKIEWGYRDKKTKEYKTGKPFMAPEWASVAVWKKNQSRPTIAKVWWSEIYPDVSRSPLVREKPRLMIGKCASSQTIRKAYPDTGGLYIPEEFAGKRPEFTPEGRHILEAPETEQIEQGEVIDVNPHEEAYNKREQEGLKKLTQDQRKIVEERIADSKATTMQYRLMADADQNEPRWVISGPTDLKKKYRELLEPYVDREKQKIIVDAKGLGILISRFEALKEPFKEVGIHREPGE